MIQLNILPIYYLTTKFIDGIGGLQTKWLGQKTVLYRSFSKIFRQITLFAIHYSYLKISNIVKQESTLYNHKFCLGDLILIVRSVFYSQILPTE